MRRPVGTSVGRLAIGLVGGVVGLSVGNRVGRLVGIGVGHSVETGVGHSVGTGVGRWVGTLVGSFVGRGVGLRVGAGCCMGIGTDGSQAPHSIGNSKTTRRHASTSVGYAFARAVFSQVIRSPQVCAPALVFQIVSVHVDVAQRASGCSGSPGVMLSRLQTEDTSHLPHSVGNSKATRRHASTRFGY